MSANSCPTEFTDEKLKKLKEDLKKHIVIDLIQDDGLRLLERLEAAEIIVNGAEMAWVVMANVSGGNWKDQPNDWQEAAARWRDEYHKDLDVWSKTRGPIRHK